MKWLFHMRRDYNNTKLTINSLSENPIDEFDLWFKRAIEIEKFDPNAMAMATSTSSGKPSVRFVLLKSYNERGFVFYTNYESKKSEQIFGNPFAAFVFYWPELQQQVRVEGKIEKLGQEESDIYFDSRPARSKIGAWASPQSKPIPSREYLEDLKNDYLKKYKDRETPRPDFWGGYRIVPNKIEFWQGRPDRLHDRFEYQLKNNNWNKVRLAP